MADVNNYDNGNNVFLYGDSNLFLLPDQKSSRGFREVFRTAKGWVNDKLNKTMEDTQKLLEDIIKSIVQNSDEVKIEKVVDERGVLFRIWVNQKDMGLVIGKAGVTAGAIKHIVKLAGYKTKSAVSIKIEEPNKLWKQ